MNYRDKGRGTFNRLLSKKVQTHRLDGLCRSLVLPFRLADNLRQILQDQPAGHIRPLSSELGEVVSDAAADINEEDIVWLHLHALDQRLHREEPLVHPRWPALVVRRHVVIELLCEGRVCGDEVEEVRVCAVAVLEGCVRAVAGVDVVCFLEVRGEACQAEGDAVCPVSKVNILLSLGGSGGRTCRDRRRCSA